MPLKSKWKSEQFLRLIFQVFLRLHLHFLMIKIVMRFVFFFISFFVIRTFSYYKCCCCSTAIIFSCRILKMENIYGFSWVSELEIFFLTQFSSVAYRRCPSAHSFPSFDRMRDVNSSCFV